MTESMVVLCSLCLGSFANVFRARFPKGESLWRPGSRCPQCGHAIRWWHNIPVLGWLVLRGRCHDCGNKISPAYPAMEAAFGILAGLWTWRFGTGMESLAYLALCECLLMAAWTDWDTGFLYDALTLPLLAAGLASAALFPGQGRGAEDPLLGAAGMLALMWAMAWLGGKWMGREALGGGDLKLMAAGGAWLGFAGACKALMLGSLLGLPLMLLHQRLRGKHWREAAPFGPGLCAGLIWMAADLAARGALDPFFGF